MDTNMEALSELERLASRLERRANEYNDRSGNYTYIGDDVALDDQAATALRAAARERDALRDDLVVLTSAVDEFAMDFIMAHDASPDDSCLRLTAFREAVARLCAATRHAAEASERINWNCNYDFAKVVAYRIVTTAPAALEGSSSSETGWLIEKWDSKTEAFGAEWWAIHPSFEDGCGWTKDSIIALRFARETDAAAYIDDIGWTEAKPTEHAWPALQPSSAADAKPVACSDEALEIANANHEKFERLWYLAKDDVDRLKLAICGGEYVPGAIDAVSVEDCEGFIAEGRSLHIDTEARLEYVRRSRDGAADRADRLYRALVEVRDSVETYPLDDSQTCMCGSPVEGHNVGSGHAPVSQADHAISLIVEAIDKALGVAAIPDHALIGAGRPDDYEGPDVGMHDTEIVESKND